MKKETSLSIIAIFLMMSLILGGQYVCDLTRPKNIGGTELSETLGKAGFSYLTGIRKMTAYFLYNRLDVIHDTYYHGIGMKNHLHLIPELHIIQKLNPEIIPVYYLQSHILASNDKMEDAIEFNNIGIKENPESGLLLANQITLYYQRDGEETEEDVELLAEKGIQDDIRYIDTEDAFFSLAIFRDTYENLGREDIVEKIKHDLNNLKNNKIDGCYYITEESFDLSY